MLTSETGIEFSVIGAPESKFWVNLMVKTARHAIGVLLALSAAVSVFADDQQKAQQQITKITAMAIDVTARRIVSMSMSEMVGVSRPELVQQRRDTGLNYGSLFVAHQLAAGGTGMADIATQLRAGKNIFQIGNDQHADWKRIASEAKKLNSRIEKNIYRHFLDPAADGKRDQADKYDVMSDGVRSDNDVTPRDIAEAQERYLLWRDRAAGPNGGRLDSADEQAARHGHDHIRDGGSLQTGTPTGPH